MHIHAHIRIHIRTHTCTHMHKGLKISILYIYLLCFVCCGRLSLDTTGFFQHTTWCVFGVFCVFWGVLWVCAEFSFTAPRLEKRLENLTFAVGVFSVFWYVCLVCYENFICCRATGFSYQIDNR